VLSPKRRSLANSSYVASKADRPLQGIWWTLVGLALPLSQGIR